MIFNTEAEFEVAVIQSLAQKGWESDVLKYPTEQDLLQNWAEILFANNRSIDRLNDAPLTDGEMNQIMEQIMLLTTASTLEGYRIVKQCGLVFGESVFKHGFLKSLGASVSDTVDKIRFGSHEMSGSTSLIQSARDYAYEKMMKQAIDKGANAIVAIDSDNTIGGDIMYISLYGTAVKVVPEEDYEKEKKLEREKEEQEKARIEKMKEEIARQKQEIANDIEQMKQDGAEPVNVSAEEMFIARMKEEGTATGIWKLWSIYELGAKHRNIDTYLSMRKDTELQQGKLNNIEQIKGIVEQMLQKEMQD